MKPMGIIIKKMERILYDKKPYRLTALKQLQEEELGDPFKILIGTILSSRTRDETTTKVVKTLFKRFKNAKELAQGNLEEVKQIIHSIGFYNVKAKRIIEVSQLIVKRFDGKVPNSIEKLLELPGVGRKTANCVLVYGFNKPTIPVDTHVHRISNRIGLVNTKTPEKTEIELNNIINKKYWLRLNNIFVMYGQNICLPVAPKCELCELKKMCKFYHASAKT
ncbi:MAG TPA: endonuclease III [Nitrososphaeraceae archaeon]|nr:endonuclease III [Nitrososphaeraceae archaeon]